MQENDSTDTYVGNLRVCNVDDNGNTLLHQALLKDVIYGDNLLDLLINGKVYVNAKNNKGQTVLHVVASRINVTDVREIFTTEKLVGLLIKNGMHVDAQDNYGNTALHLAVGGAKPRLLNYKDLQASHIKQSSQLANPDKLVVSYIFKTKAYVFSTSKQYLSMIETLSKVCDLNVRNSLGKTALHIVAECCNVEAVKTLLEAGSDVNTKDNKGNTALHCTFIGKGYVGHSLLVFTALLDRGANVNIQNNKGETPLHLFIDCCVQDAHCTWDIDFKLILTRGVDVNLQDKKGETCLIRAVRKKLRRIGVEYILSHKALLNLTDNEGNSALHYAAMSLSEPMMRTLTVAGADSNIQNNDGKTPLHIIFQLHDSFSNLVTKDLIELSLSRGFNVNLQDRNGDTLLHLVTQSYWQDELLNLLLVRGARIDLENNKGETVTDLYIENLYQTCSEVDMIKLTKAGHKYYMTNGIKTVVSDTLRSEFFEKSCLKELVRMKQTKIGSIFSRYDDPVYVADVELEQLVTFDNVADQFPIYSILLLITYEKAKRRNHLLDVLSYNFDISGNPLTLISEIKRIILSYLSDKDLSNLFEAIGLKKCSKLYCS